MLELHTKDGHPVIVTKDKIQWFTDDPGMLQAYGAKTGCVIMMENGAIVVMESYDILKRQCA